ncbi:MAG: CRISPR-associated endonuclease Cas2 [Leadbetterella sp.]|jgi:CRISPR-associated protein Cas2|nr:CRISPR-associated endonuclease Cas2 [Leadbetterella sp.]
MWVIVYFDLPTETKKDKRAYQDFRKALQKDGFRMMQYSVYFRHCNSRENAEVHKRRVKNNMPVKGNIIVFEITDAQFGRMEFYNGYKRTQSKENPQQLEMF